MPSFFFFFFFFLFLFYFFLVVCVRYPLWGRQVPYTMIKFVGFYLTADFVYETLDKSYGIKKSEMSTNSQLAVTFASGYWAGIFCAVATQPMDNLVSMKGNPINKDKSWGTMASEMGTRNLFRKQPRKKKKRTTGGKNNNMPSGSS
jgi:hypothetical protein